MTDANEDRLEEIKNKKVYEFMYLAADQNDFTEDDKRWLIKEVERLRKFASLPIGCDSHKKIIFSQENQIDSLTKENAELKQKLAEAKGKVEAYSNFVDKCFLKECPENRELFSKLMEVI